MSPFRIDPRELFRGASRSNLPAYFLAMRDFLNESPFPTRARGEEMSLEELQAITSTLNRFSESGTPNAKDSINDVLVRLFADKPEVPLLIEILVNGCNRHIQSENLSDMVPALNMARKGSALEFQSFAEGIAEALRLRYGR